jgi:hypothetical protein
MSRQSRPRELQDALNFHLYHPLAWWLARRLARTPITPNMISVAGGLCIVAAAIAYTRLAWPLSAALGLLFHMAWHVLDGADGDVARLTGRSGPIGEVIDGICDYAGHVVLYLALGAMLQRAIGPIAWMPTIAAGMSRILQANHFEVERRQYQWWVYAVPWLRNAPRGEFRNKGGLFALGAAYLAVANSVAPTSRRIDDAIEAAANDPAALEKIRSVVRGQFLKPLAGLQLLGANQRTLMLGLSMLFGSPIYYFLYESIILNFLLFRSIGRCRTATIRVDALLGQPRASVLR